VSDLENNATIRIGDLLEQAGLVTSTDLSEAVSVSKRLQLPIGRVLIMSGCVTERILKSAIEAQSMLRDRSINLAKALETLVKVAEEDVSFQTALTKVDPNRVPGSYTNKLGEILIEFELITEEQLQDALIQSLESGTQLGAALVAMDLISPALLPLLLRTQEQIRVGLTTRQQAAAEFKSSYAMWIKAEASFRTTGSGTELQTQYAQAMQQRAMDPHEAYYRQFGHPPQPAPGQYPAPMPPPNPYQYPPGYPPAYPVGYQPPYPLPGYPPNTPYPYPPPQWQGLSPDQIPQPPTQPPYGVPPGQWPPTQFPNPQMPPPLPLPNNQTPPGGYPAPPANLPPQQYPNNVQPPGAPGQQHHQQWQQPAPSPPQLSPRVTPQPAAPPQLSPRATPQPASPSAPMALSGGRPNPNLAKASTRLPALNASTLTPVATPIVEPQPTPPAQNLQIGPDAVMRGPGDDQTTTLDPSTQSSQVVSEATVPAFERVISRKLKKKTGEQQAVPEGEPATSPPGQKRPGSRNPLEGPPPKSTGEITVRLTSKEIERFCQIVDQTPSTTTPSAPAPAATTPTPPATSNQPLSEESLTETLRAFSRSVEIDIDELAPAPPRLSLSADTMINFDAYPISSPDRALVIEPMVDSPVETKSSEKIPHSTVKHKKAPFTVKRGALVGEETEPVAETTESVPEQTEPVAEISESLSEQTEPVAEISESLSEQTEPVAETTESVPEQTEPVAEISESLSEQTEPVAEISESLSEQTEPVVEKSEPARDEDTLIDYEPRPAHVASSITDELDLVVPLPPDPSETASAEKSATAGGADSQQNETDTLIDYDPHPVKGQQVSLPNADTETPNLHQVHKYVESDSAARAESELPSDSIRSSDTIDVLAELKAVQEELASALDFTPHTYQPADSTTFSSFQFDFETPPYANLPVELAPTTSDEASKDDQTTASDQPSGETPTVSELPVVNFRLGNTLHIPDTEESQSTSEVLDSTENQTPPPTPQETSESTSSSPALSEPLSVKDEVAELTALFTTVIESQNLRKHSRLSLPSFTSLGNGHDKSAGNGFENLDKKRGKSKNKGDQSKTVVEAPEQEESSPQDRDLESPEQSTEQLSEQSSEPSAENRRDKTDKSKERKKAKRKTGEQSLPLVDILKQAGLFSEQDLNDAFASSLANTNLLPDLLTTIGVISNDLSKDVNRCQAMLSCGDLKSKQAVALLKAIKEGKSFEEAADELQITPTAKT
jgi:hypothetical protein